MYRDLAKSDADRQWLRSHKLRYDLTVIPPSTLCGEWVKTKGHYHPRNSAGTGFPEVYEVLDGEAKYLLQSRRLDDVVMLSAHAGDTVIIPPDYGHISINPSADKTLAMVNIVSTAFESEYGEYETLNGAAYYAMSDGSLKKNPHYPKIPEVRYPGTHWRSAMHQFCKGPLYNLIGNEDLLAFLNFPEHYPGIFPNLLKG
jgi:glucose-6-phosphate isomerase